MRLAHDALVYEVRCRDRPAAWDVVALDLDLFAKDLLSDFAPVFADIRPPSHHALVADHADRKVVRDEVVVLAAHHLGGHVARGARGLAGVVRSHDAGDAEVSEP